MSDDKQQPSKKTKKALPKKRELKNTIDMANEGGAAGAVTDQCTFNCMTVPCTMDPHC